METTLALWIGFNLFVVALLAFDLGLLQRKGRALTVPQALWLSFGYFVIAMIFAAGVFRYRGDQAGWEFLTGYLIEKSLSVDNIFVFVLIFAHFAVPPVLQRKVLVWGILGALAMRSAMIAAGAALIATFHWVVLLFGAFLLLTGIKMLVAADAEPDIENNRVLLLAKRWLRVTPDYVGDRFLVRRDGLLWVTPLFLVLLLVEVSDAVFALDSIPAIFAVSQDPFIVYTANVFAILGLRALYFALAGVMDRFHYLKYGLSLVLVLIGVKMILNGIAGEKVIPVEAALVATAVLIGGSMALSWLRPPAVPGAPPRGWLPLSRRKKPAGDRPGKG